MLNNISSVFITLKRLIIFRKERTSAKSYMKKRSTLTVRCWKSHALRMFVATLGKIPRFFWFFFPDESSSSSPVPSPLPILALLASPATVRGEPRSSRAVSVINENLWHNSRFLYFVSRDKCILTYFFKVVLHNEVFILFNKIYIRSICPIVSKI